MQAPVGSRTSQALVQLFDHALQTKDAYYLASPAGADNNTARQSFRDWVLREFVLDE